MMPILSLLLNVAVLLPVCVGLAIHADWVEQAYGPRSPARGILLAVYGAILLASLGLLAWREPVAIATLLALQVAYKLATPFTVGTVRNPVVASNLLIAAFHIGTLSTLAQGARS